MKRRLFLTAVAATLVPVLPAEAKKRKRKKGKKGKSEADKRREERAKKRAEEKKAVDKILDERDTNNDGSLSQVEFVSGADDQDQAARDFIKYNKNRDRNLTRSEIADYLGFD